jgi:hypothetical protein
MLGDTAVAVHPEDERYAHLVGKCIRLPLTDRDIPIIADDYVERELGSLPTDDVRGPALARSPLPARRLVRVGCARR